jgi:ATP-binding cassette subfamily F protein 3
MMFEGDDALKKISVLSGGERSRVLLGKILATPSNVLLLDEPTNHLDVESVMALTDALEEFEGAVVIVTHSEEILRRVATRLIVFQGDAPFVFEGNYDEFLDSIGWEGEEQVAPSKGKKKRSKSGGSDLKRDKAETIQERSRVLTPLKTGVSELERKVADLERSVESSQSALALASSTGERVEIERISRDLANARRELEKTLAEWEVAQRKLEDAERAFAEQLRDFVS